MEKKKKVVCKRKPNKLEGVSQTFELIQQYYHGVQLLSESNEAYFRFSFKQFKFQLCMRAHFEAEFHKENEVSEGEKRESAHFSFQN